jgi:hypothetical protein
MEKITQLDDDYLRILVAICELANERCEYEDVDNGLSLANYVNQHLLQTPRSVLLEMVNKYIKYE